MMRLENGWIVLGMVAALPMLGQQTGTVTGHVTCGDTQRPARFSGVTLVAVPEDAGPSPTVAVGGLKISNNKEDMVQTETELDGSYSVSGVAPGDYYVLASVPGYVQPWAVALAAIDAGADAKKQIPGIPVVHVGVESGASMDVTVQRGGAISGHVSWDDSSPAAKVIVTAISTKATGKDLLSQGAMMAFLGGFTAGGMVSISDDLGQYRIAGLAPGEYLVKATLQLQSGFSMQNGVVNMASMGSNKPLVVYAPANFHKAEAKAVTLHAGDEVTGEDLTIKLTGMHGVSGRVVSAEDGHGLNAGVVELTDASDKDVVRGAGVDASGNFVVEFIPPGTYSLSVNDAGDTEAPKKDPKVPMVFASPTVVRMYEGGKQSVVVTDTDVTGLNISLQPMKAKGQ